VPLRLRRHPQWRVAGGKQPLGDQPQRHLLEGGEPIPLNLLARTQRLRHLAARRSAIVLKAVLLPLLCCRLPLGVPLRDPAAVVSPRVNADALLELTHRRTHRERAMRLLHLDEHNARPLVLHGRAELAQAALALEEAVRAEEEHKTRAAHILLEPVCGTWYWLDGGGTKLATRVHDSEVHVWSPLPLRKSHTEHRSLS